MIWVWPGVCPVGAWMTIHDIFLWVLFCFFRSKVEVLELYSFFICDNLTKSSSNATHDIFLELCHTRLSDPPLSSLLYITLLRPFHPSPPSEVSFESSVWFRNCRLRYDILSYLIGKNSMSFNVGKFVEFPNLPFDLRRTCPQSKWRSEHPIHDVPFPSPFLTSLRGRESEFIYVYYVGISTLRHFRSERNLLSPTRSLVLTRVKPPGGRSKTLTVWPHT